MDPILEEWFKLHKFYKRWDFLTKDLAEYLNVSPRIIQMWIKGKRRPNPKKLEKIKEYLKNKGI